MTGKKSIVNLINFEESIVRLVQARDAATHQSLVTLLRLNDQYPIVVTSSAGKEGTDIIYDALSRINKRSQSRINKRSRVPQRKEVVHYSQRLTKAMANGELSEILPVVYAESVDHSLLKEIAGSTEVPPESHPLVVAQFIKNTGRPVRVTYLNDVGQLYENGTHFLTQDAADFLQGDLALDYIASIKADIPELLASAIIGHLNPNGEDPRRLLVNFNYHVSDMIRAKYMALRSQEKSGNPDPLYMTIEYYLENIVGQRQLTKDNPVEYMALRSQETRMRPLMQTTTGYTTRTQENSRPTKEHPANSAELVVQ